MEKQVLEEACYLPKGKDEKAQVGKSAMGKKPMRKMVLQNHIFDFYGTLIHPNHEKDPQEGIN